MNQLIFNDNWMTAGKTVSGTWLALILSISVFTGFAPGTALAKNWALSLGGGGYASNVYMGSDDIRSLPIPYMKASYTVKTFSTSLSLLDGLGISYMNPEKHFMADFSINGGEKRDSEKYYALGATIGHSDRTRKLLEGSPTVSTLVCSKMMLGYLSPFGILGVSTEYHRITREEETDRSYDGFIPSFSWMLPYPLTQELSATFVLSLSMMDRHYADAWYSVDRKTPALDIFNADAGFRDIQLAVQADYMLSERQGITFITGMSRLLGDAAESPYTTANRQLRFACYGFYNF